MDYLKLKVTYDELLERIDRYFDCKLMKEPRARTNLETYKDELLQTLQIQLWLNHRRQTYDTYSLEKFIWLKAKKVWIEFTRSLKRQQNQKSNFEFAELPENSFVSSFFHEFESKNTVAVIESLLSQNEIELLRYRAQGFTYKQIKELANYPSEAAAKTKFNRIKKFIRIRFDRL